MERATGPNGFTLIEIMVVVFIIGLLAALVVPKVVRNTDKARVAKAKADIRAIEEAAGLYKLDVGRFPATAEGLEALVNPSSNRADPDGYLDKVPVDPWGNEYAYFGDGRRVVIKSYGADGVEGGDGWDADIDNYSLD